MGRTHNMFTINHLLTYNCNKQWMHWNGKKWYKLVHIKNDINVQYSGDLNSKLVRNLNGPKQLARRMVRYSDVSLIQMFVSQIPLVYLYNTRNLETSENQNYVSVFKWAPKHLETGILEVLDAISLLYSDVKLDSTFLTVADKLRACLMWHWLCWSSISTAGRVRDLAGSHFLSQHGTPLEALHKNFLHYSGKTICTGGNTRAAWHIIGMAVSPVHPPLYFFIAKIVMVLLNLLVSHRWWH